MNYIKTYKIFESESKPSNDDYYKLCLILMDELMDDLDIYSKTDENFNDEDNIPLNKFWAFSGLSYKSNSILSSNLSDFDIINKLLIFNIPELEIEDVCNFLNKEYLDRLYSILGYKVSYERLEVLNYEYNVYFYDIEFKLS